MSVSMEKASKKELLTVINQQNEKISRFETRLRDVVVAYKGLIKEKEALELSVKALSTSKSSTRNIGEDQQQKRLSEIPEVSSEEESESSKELVNKTDDEQSDEMIKKLHQQLSTLTNSLATLSAEKSRMEASFQADKKQLRTEREERGKLIKDLQEKNQAALNEVENLKSKLVLERHERDKERNDHGVMIRELQKLLSDERRRLEQSESNCDELSSKLLQMEQLSGQNERKLRDTKNELEATRRKLKRAEAELKSQEAPPLLLELQEEMANLKQQHQTAILQEQKRVIEAEERARKLAALHEERVANLEARLAELSDTVGTYDRLRQQDQAAIVKLKDRIAQLDLETDNCALGAGRSTSGFNDENDQSEAQVQLLMDQISELKAELHAANDYSEKALDTQEKEDIHKECAEEIKYLKGEVERLKNQQKTHSHDEDDTASLVNALKERIQLLNGQMNDREESKKIIENLQKMLKVEKARSKSELAAVETDYRCRLSLLEQQLQKQRERSLMLLEDKEHEIRMLKSSFGMFLPGATASLNLSPSQLQEYSNKNEDDQGKPITPFGLSKKNGNGGESPHMLHYAHEIARRDVEISNLRRANHSLEGSLRERNRRLASEEALYEEQMSELKEEVARLKRCQSREGANLEYLKNVVLSFLTSSDSSCKRPMLNAIAAVLKFSAAEMERVNRINKTPVQPITR